MKITEMEQTLAPIVLFVYNRPWHTQQTVEALSDNDLADKSVLYVFADGPHENADASILEKISETRAVIKQKQWCKEVILVEREKNMGLADSILTGVTEIIDKHEKIIVLEDDIITSPGFLTYMNEALDLYKKKEKVWHVSAYWYPAKGSKKLPDTFFYNAATCWGWGTWKRSWINIMTDPVLINERLRTITDGIYHFNVENGYNFYEQLALNINGKIKTWAVKWYSSIFINNALSLHPNHSLTNNIGHDGTGSNCYESTVYTWKRLARSIQVKEIPLRESFLSRKLIKSFFLSHSLPKRSNLHKIKSAIKTTIKGRIKKLFINKGYKILYESKDQFAHLVSAERYQQLNVPLLGREFLIADGRSFYYSYKEIFEDEIYKFNCENNSPVIVDCGCNYGTSVLYFKSIFPDAKIVGFEADPYIFNILQTNVTCYQLNHVTIHNKALWKEETFLKFFSEKADGGRIELNTDTGDRKFITVETAVLSNVIKDLQVDFLKMDIEGAEIDVLLECEQYLENVSKIFIEYHSFSDKAQQLDILLSLLTKNEFRYQIHTVLSSAKPFVEKEISSGMDMQLNIFAFRE